MAIAAQEAEAGKVYRRTRNEHRGAYYMRPKTVDARTLIRKMRKQTRLSGRDLWLIGVYQRHPEFILLRRYLRGTDFITGEKWEFSHYVLFPPDYSLRECKAKPGYK
jgi:hypothetical protein